MTNQTPPRHWLYIIHFGESIKIGQTRDLKERLRTLNHTFSDEKIDFGQSMYCRLPEEMAATLEGLMVKKYKDHRVPHEKVKTELFHPEILEGIIEDVQSFFDLFSLEYGFEPLSETYIGWYDEDDFLRIHHTKMLKDFKRAGWVPKDMPEDQEGV